jgi:lysophospholipase L1-like esterase
MDYIAVGDSFATGFPSGVGYPDLFARHLGEDLGARIELDNRGVNGLTAAELAENVEQEVHLRAALAQAEVITWNIGGNDFGEARNAFLIDQCGGADGERCLRDAVAQINRDWKRIFVAIAKLRSTSEAIVRVVSCYYPFVAQDRQQGIYEVTDRYVDDLDTNLQSLARRFDVPLADVYGAFNEDEQDPIAAGFIDGGNLHPTPAGHQLTADLLRDLGYAPLG